MLFKDAVVMVSLKFTIAEKLNCGIGHTPRAYASTYTLHLHTPSLSRHLFLSHPQYTLKPHIHIVTQCNSDIFHFQSTLMGLDYSYKAVYTYSPHSNK